MKQTAVEWLKKQLESYGDPSNLKLDWETLDELIEQAKEMEETMVCDGWDDGYEKGLNLFQHLYQPIPFFF